MTAVRRPVVPLLALAVTGFLIGGCGTLPGTSPEGWTLTASFDDAVNLPEGAAVKAGGLEVGEVTDITVEDYTAKVTMVVDEGTTLRRGSDFRLRYTTALGEVYVDVTSAESGERLADGDVLTVEETATAPSVEDTLASASLLINGGSLGQVQTIASELNNALDGRVGATRGMLREIDRFLGQTVRSTRQIDRILRALNRSSRVLDRREDTLNRALRELRPAARTLAENTDDLARLLRATERMARTTDDLVVRTREDLELIVDELGPVLDSVLGIEQELVAGLGTVNQLAGNLDRAVPNDYLNLYFVLHATSVLSGDAGTPANPGTGDPGSPGQGPVPGAPGVELPGLPPVLPEPDLGPVLGGGR